MISYTSNHCKKIITRLCMSKWLKKENGNIIYVKMLKRRMATFIFDHKNPEKYFVLQPKVLSIQIKWHFGLGCFFLETVNSYQDVQWGNYKV